ncbi:MAG: YidC/Oxa1 family membrane protein insertase [Chloroflexi bacterium]|jgi:YidC/Oxa1 family membrane protein insertase|nr:MAG: YidC/Oxa1 family membrane protein insertase [Chloroflexota bacterium]
MEFIGGIWNGVIIRPMINSLVLLYSLAFSNFGVSIILFTLLIRAVLFPLTVKQSKQMKAMQAIQPKLKAMQEKYKNDRQKVSQETMRLYRENGVNPLGCLGPMFIQFPIWIGLYQAIIQTLPSTPERLATLSNKLYWWLPSVHKAVPLNGDFFGLDLAVPDPTKIVLPVLVGVSMFVMQKMTTMPSTSPTQDSTNRMMLWMMPVMFGFFTIQFPSGLAIYWIVSNIVGIIIQGFATGWDPLLKILNFQVVSQPSAVTANAIAGNEEVENEEEYDSDDGEDRRRRNRAGSKATRRKSRRSRNRRN